MGRSSVKLSQLQEARYYQCQYVDRVKEIAQRLKDRNEEEYGFPVPEDDRQGIIRDMDKHFERAQPDEDAHDEGDLVWTVEVLNKRRKIEVTLFDRQPDNPHLVVYKY